MSSETETPAAPQLVEKTSTNWCGYMVTGPRDSFTSVSAKWRVPPPLTPPPTPDYYVLASFWVGLNGSKVEPECLTQAGNDVNDYNGAHEFETWYELELKGNTGHTALGSKYPAPAGDELSCTISYQGGLEFIIDLRNLTRSWTYRQTHGFPPGTPAPAMNSAEIIVEAPIFAGKLGKLTNFGLVEFTDILVDGRPISAFAGQTTRLCMVNDTALPAEGDNLIASPGPLGTSFAATWHNFGRVRAPSEVAAVRSARRGPGFPAGT